MRREILADLGRFEKRIHSQNGEDGLIEAIFARIGATNRTYVEFGVGTAYECNTQYLKGKGWVGLQMDPADSAAPGVRREFVTAENIEVLLEKYAVPVSFDLLSIDVDGNDYWIWKAIGRWRPRVIVIEYNSQISLDQSCVIAYDPAFDWDGSGYYGAGLSALKKLGDEKGYTLVACDSSGINAFFVDDRIVPGNFKPASIEALYRRSVADYGESSGKRGKTWVFT